MRNEYAGKPLGFQQGVIWFKVTNAAEWRWGSGGGGVGEEGSRADVETRCECIAVIQVQHRVAQTRVEQGREVNGLETHGGDRNDRPC